MEVAVATWLWVGFLVLVFGFLALDLGVFNRKDHVIGTREALGWTLVWVVMALLFGGGVYYIYEHKLIGASMPGETAMTGMEATVKYLTGYLIEKSLSLDNIAVIAIVFTYFKVPRAYQHRLLFWGILGALVMRGIMIGAGAALIARFSWMIYVFGVFLLFTAWKMLKHVNESPDIEHNKVLILARKYLPVTKELHGHSFFTRLDGKLMVTPLFLALLVVETSDVIFAVDSIPAIFAVTYDPFLVFTSNVFAILGLRSLYFVLASLLGMFHYLNHALVVILFYVGVKMLVSHVLPIPSWVSLVVIAVSLIVGVLASIKTGRHTMTSIPPKRA